VDPQTVLAATHQTQSTVGYDAAGNQTRATDYGGDTTTTNYDGDNRVVQSVAVSSTSTITSTPGYDPDGNTLTTTTQTYNGAGPVQTTALTATYNGADWPMSAAMDGAPTTYGYDGAGQQRTQTILNGVAPITNTLNAEGLVSFRGLHYTTGSRPTCTSPSRRKWTTGR
jgi:YD repeat-containing protein